MSAGAPAILLYDGYCRFCRGAAGQLVKLARRGAIELVSFRDPGVIEKYAAAGVTAAALEDAMHLVLPDGRVYRGFEAAVRAFATRRVVGAIGFLYYLPGLRQLFDALYAWIARNRLRWWPPDCADEACQLHFDKRKKPKS